MAWHQVGAMPLPETMLMEVMDLIIYYEGTIYLTQYMDLPLSDTIWWHSSLQWHHNEHDGVSNHQPHDCLPNCYSGADQRKQQSSASLALLRGIHQWPVNFLHKGPVMQKMFPFDDVIMLKSTMAQVMAWCLVAPIHYLNQCWLIISEVPYHSHESNFTESAPDNILCH